MKYNIVQSIPTWLPIYSGNYGTIWEDAPNMSIIYIDEIEAYCIALNGCGMDMSDSIAYAYMVLDKYVPKSTIPTDRMTLSKECWDKLQEFLNN